MIDEATYDGSVIRACTRRGERLLVQGYPEPAVFMWHEGSWKECFDLDLGWRWRCWLQSVIRSQRCLRSSNVQLYFDGLVPESAFQQFVCAQPRPILDASLSYAESWVIFRMACRMPELFGLVLSSPALAIALAYGWRFSCQIDSAFTTRAHLSGLTKQAFVGLLGFPDELGGLLGRLDRRLLFRDLWSLRLLAVDRGLAKYLQDVNPGKSFRNLLRCAADCQAELLAELLSEPDHLREAHIERLHTLYLGDSESRLKLRAARCLSELSAPYNAYIRRVRELRLSLDPGEKVDFLLGGFSNLSGVYEQWMPVASLPPDRDVIRRAVFCRIVGKLRMLGLEPDGEGGWCVTTYVGPKRVAFDEKHHTFSS